MLGTRKSSIFSFIFVAALASLAALASPLGAQNRARETSTKLEMTPAQRTFSQAYLAAVTGPDIDRYIRLLHPRTRACITTANAEFFNTIFARRVGRVARNPRSSISKLKGSGMFSSANPNGLSYPERPTHSFQIDLVSSGSRQSALIVYAVKENGIWYEVLPCPSAKSLQMMREAKLQNAADSAKARQLADSLQDPLRAEVLALLQESGVIDAVKRYSEAAQVDLTMARRVVKALEQDITLIH
jgi:hypothetical protein